MPYEIKEATANRAFSCERCNSAISQGNTFYWDNRNKTELRPGVRICMACIANAPTPNDSKPIGPSAPYSKDRDDLKAEIATLKAKLDHALKELADFGKQRADKLAALESRLDKLEAGKQPTQKLDIAKIAGGQH